MLVFGVQVGIFEDIYQSDNNLLELIGESWRLGTDVLHQDQSLTYDGLSVDGLGLYQLAEVGKQGGLGYLPSQGC